MPVRIDVMAADGLWVVRCQSAEYGRYVTQVQAFNAAVAEARKMKQRGRSAQVRIVREDDPSETKFVSLL